MPVDVSGISSMGDRVDQVQMNLIWLMVFCFVACNAVLIFFILHYRRRKDGAATPDLRGSHLLESLWTAIPTAVVILIFIYGTRVWSSMREVPADALPIKVTARQWSWSFHYADGRVEPRELVVPVGRAIRLDMISEDVIHGLFLPHFRLKEDVVPGQYTYLWFQADRPGSYPIFCTEYCGKDHSYMMGSLKVLEEDAWQAWLAGSDATSTNLPPEELGRLAFEKWGCMACHALDGGTGLGPSLTGLHGREEHFEDGTSLVADDNYLRESMLSPGARIVRGYTTQVMPSYQGQLKEEDIAAVIAFIKSLH